MQPLLIQGQISRNGRKTSKQTVCWLEMQAVNTAGFREHRIHLYFPCRLGFKCVCYMFSLYFFFYYQKKQKLQRPERGVDLCVWLTVLPAGKLKHKNSLNVSYKPKTKNNLLAMALNIKIHTKQMQPARFSYEPHQRRRSSGAGRGKRTERRQQ